MPLFQEKITVPPYSQLAYLYDFVMNHVNYKRWARYISQIAHHHGNGTRTITDISCGTGSLSRELLKLGYHVTGFDYTPEMVSVARRKLKKQPNVQLWCGDMMYPNFTHKPDMIVSLYDSMNYLMKSKQWNLCLENVHSALKPDGLFVFDVSTLQNSLEMFTGFTQKEKNAQGSYVRKSRFDKKEHIQINYFEIRFHKNKTIYCETHRQKIRSLENVLSIIDQSPFTLSGYYHDFTFNPGSETSERIHFVLRK